MDKEIKSAYKIIFVEYSDVVTSKELSKMLGVSMKKVYAMLKNGDIPTIPCGKKIKVAKAEVIKYVLQCAQQTTHI